MKKALSVIGAMMILAAVGGCQSSEGPGNIDVDSVAFTVVRTTNLDGTVSETHEDPDLVGPKEVRVGITVNEPTELLTILLTYWRAGNNGGSETIERSVDQSYDPPSGGIGLFHFIEIPGVEDFEQCEAFYYMTTVNYKDENEQPGVWIGSPKLVMPTKKLANGQIEQATCAEPPGPDE